MKEHIDRNPLPVIIFTVFVDLLGVGILIPVIPLLLADPQSPYYLLPAGMSVNQGYILLGFLLASFSIAQFLATPILGELSDRYGRKKILIISLAGTCLSYVLFAIGIITKNLPLLFISRSFDGITGGNISVAQAAIADVTTPENRAKNFGLIGAAFGLGFIIGPYLGGKLSDPHLVSWFSASTPFFFAAILSAVNVVSMIFFFPETLKHVKEHVTIHWGKSIMNIAKAFTLPRLNVLFITNFLFQGGFTFFTSFFGVFLINKFHFTQGNIGDFFAYVGLWIALTQAVITRRLSSMFAEYKIVRIALMGCALAVLLYFIPDKWWGLLFIAPFFAISNGLTQANTVGLVSRNADAKIQGEVLGINSSVQALAQAIPLMLSGYIAAKLTPDSPLLVSAAVIAASGFVFLFLYKPQDSAAAPAHAPASDVPPARPQSPAEEPVEIFHG